MFLRNFWAYVLGYLVLFVRGGHPERFINLALTRGIVLWDLVRLDRETLLVKVYARSFRQLRHIARRANCRIRIRMKRGLPFYLYRLRRRRVLVAGGFIFCAIVYALCSFVWTVDVVGARRISPETIRRMAAEAGLRPGVLKYKVDGNYVADHLMQRLPGVAFVEVDVKGRAVIRVGERVVAKSETNPCHVVAGKDGVIESLLVLVGSPRVKEGDVVKKGDVLISGIIRPSPGEKSQVRYVAAKGIVRARVWYRSYGEALLSEIKEEKTGRKAKIISLKLCDKEIIIKGPAQIPYRFYRLKVKRLKIPKWREITFPVEFATIEAEEYRRVWVKRSEEEALRLAMERASRQMAELLPEGAAVVRRYWKPVVGGDSGLEAVVLTVETVEEIGVRREFRPKEREQSNDTR